MSFSIVFGHLGIVFSYLGIVFGQLGTDFDHLGSVSWPALAWVSLILVTVLYFEFYLAKVYSRKVILLGLLSLGCI